MRGKCSEGKLQMLHTETITEKNKNLLQKLMAIEELKKTRLVGGTALALQLGHRISDDLDFFGSFDSACDLSECFSVIQDVEKTGANRTMQFFNLNGIKVDFINLEYPWIKDVVNIDGVRLASIEDIAALKVNAIIGRGTRKDFVDLFFLLKRFSLKEILSFYEEKYEKKANIQMALRSMVFFDDAESDPMPVMLKPFDWSEAKERIQDAVRQYSK